MTSTPGRSRPRIAVLLGLTAAGAGLLAGCGSSGSTAPAASSPAATASAGATPAGSAAAAGGSAADAVSIPIQLVQSAAGAALLAEISVGGGPVTKVVLDTGSVGLIIERHATGSAVRTTGQAMTTQYVGFSVHAQVSVAAVSLRGGSQAVQTAPVRIGVTSQPLKFADSLGATGILGIAPGTNQASPAPTLASPLVQLSGPLAGGYTISASPSRSTLRLGAPVAGPGSVQIAMTRAGYSYPDGRPAYLKAVPMCWTIGPARTCAPTVLDTGAKAGIVSSTILPGAPHAGGKIKAGTAIRISSRSGTSVCSTTAGSGAPNYLTLPVMNTGLRIFIADSVGFDLDTGTVIITPAPGAQC